MKLCRYGPSGAEQAGIIDNQGNLRDLSKYCNDITPTELSATSLAELQKIDVETLPLVETNYRLGPPVNGVSKFIGIGLNYADHAAETGMEAPDEPIIFLKSPSCICGPNDDIIKPPFSTKLDWELELGIVIGAKAQYVSAAEAMDFVAGFCIVNDVSERAFQFQSNQWDKGKGCDSFGPIGPWLVTKDEIDDPQNLDMQLTVNGQVKQRGNTRTMIFTVDQLIAYISHYITLMPGDIITTGTPPGVGMGLKPKPEFMQPGDELHLSISGLGQQCQRVVASTYKPQKWR